jgi:uracil-DNA glycosylase
VQQISFVPTFERWQQAARQALRADLEPRDVLWEELLSSQPGLDLFDEGKDGVKEAKFRVPRAFVEMARRVACHCAPERWGMLYRTLWRLTHGEPHLLEVSVDPDVHQLQRMDKEIRRDVHKMRAFVRFREVRTEASGEWFVAWFEPTHHIVELNAPFFRDRFASMCWSILTPGRCAHWDGRELTFTDGVTRAAAPSDDEMESLWRTYYGSIFNPARLKIHAMRAEMPKKYWKNLPEAQLIPTLVAQAPKRTGEMIARSRKQSLYGLAEPPDTRDLAKLRAAAGSCAACPLHLHATQTVFGEGPAGAEIVFVGEQPGDQEDLAGRPFVGPAGQLFDRALAEAGIDREHIYVTNAVKHFKWEPQGKRRLHKKPGAREIGACRPWLAAEMKAVKPRVLVLLGSTAAKSILGPEIRVLHDRGRVLESEFCARTLITIHPSALLRTPDEAAREEHYADFVADLRAAAKLL